MGSRTRPVPWHSVAAGPSGAAPAFWPHPDPRRRGSRGAAHDHLWGCAVVAARHDRGTDSGLGAVPAAPGVSGNAGGDPGRRRAGVRLAPASGRARGARHPRRLGPAAGSERWR